MSALAVLSVVGAYFLLLMLISYLTSRQDNNQNFFLGNKQSPWYIVAFGMIGASLSGVTFISVPGWVATSEFSYMQIVLGYFPGYMVIAFVLMPMYYRLKLTSIYSYLEQRFGKKSYKTGAAFFLLSRTIGASFRLFLVAKVLQFLVFDKLGVPFWLTVSIAVLLIWLYTFRGGIKTIIWTDTLQTLFMLSAVGICIWKISESMDFGSDGMIQSISDSQYSQIFFWEDWGDKKHFVRNFFTGVFTAIVMTGLDQDMMQKNLSCKNIGDAQKNMVWFSSILVFVNLIFLALGSLLYMYASQHGIDANGDDLFAAVAVNGDLGPVMAIFFILGLIAAAYSSADSALTSLTTSFCVDFLDIEKKEESKQAGLRKRIHVMFSVVLILMILLLSSLGGGSVIGSLLKAAGFTYGPLLGMYAFGLFTKKHVADSWVTASAILAPIISYLLNLFSLDLFGFEIGFEILIVNGLLCFLMLWIGSSETKTNEEVIDVI